MVKCAACGHEWIATPSLRLDHAIDDAPRSDIATRLKDGLFKGLHRSPRAPIERSPAAMIRARHAQRERRTRLLYASGAWASAAIVLAGIFAAGAAARHPLARVWPQSASLFTAAGLKVNIYDLVIEDVETSRTQTPQGESIRVHGVIRNLRRDQQQTPPVRILWRDAKGVLISDTLGHPEKSVLEAGKLTRFESIVTGPATRAAMVEVRFGLIQGEHLAEHAPASEPSGRSLVAALRP